MLDFLLAKYRVSLVVADHLWVSGGPGGEIEEERIFIAGGRGPRWPGKLRRGLRGPGVKIVPPFVLPADDDL